MSKRFYDKGYLIDVSADGLAVFLDAEIDVETLVKVGFFLGKHKIISRRIVRNISFLAGSYRIGIEFVQL